MKKIVLILAAVLITISSAAQSADSLQSASMDARLDSLSEKLEKLQHDYDYLRCTSELNMMIHEFKIFINDINNSSDRLLVNCYHGRYDDNLYMVNVRNRSMCVSLNGSYKEKVSTLKTFVLLMLATKDFSEAEKDLLMSSLETLDKCIESADATLEYYNLAISFYKDKE